MQSNENGNTNLFTSTLFVKKGIFTPLWGELFTFSHLQTYSIAYSGSQPISLALEQQGWHRNFFLLSAITWTARYSYRKSHSRHTPWTKCPLRKRVRTHRPSNPFKMFKLKYDPCIFQYHDTQYLGRPGLKGTPRPHHPCQTPGLPPLCPQPGSPCQPLPQQSSKASLQIPTALLCLGTGPTKPIPPTCSHPLPILSPSSASGRCSMGLGLPRCPQLPCFLLHWANPTGSPCHYGHHDEVSTATSALYM